MLGEASFRLLMNDQQILTQRVTRKVRAGGSMFLALICFP